VVGIETPEVEERDSSVASFEFTNLTNISNLKELNVTSRLLNTHLRSLSKLDLSTTPSDIEIHTVSKSSPLVVTAWVSKKVAEALNKIISGAIDNFKKIQELRQMEENIRGQKLDNRSKKIEIALQERRAELEVQVIGSLSAELMRRFPEESPNGTKEEVRSGVESAVEYLITQTSKGLEIRVLPTKEDVQNETHGRDVIQKYEHILIESESVLHLLTENNENSESTAGTENG
jgi:hypothetical protein